MTAKISSSTTAPTTTVPRQRFQLPALRKASLAAGVLYLITFVSIPTVTLYSAVRDPNYVIGAGPDTPVLFGGLLEMVVALACIGTAVALYPVVRRQNESVAMGFVGMRVLEAATIVAGVVSLLSVVSLRQAGAGPDALATGHALVAQYDKTFLLGQAAAAGSERPPVGIPAVQVSPGAPDPAHRGSDRSPATDRVGRRQVLRPVRRAFRIFLVRCPADRCLGVLARRLPDRQGLQALCHHRRPGVGPPSVDDGCHNLSPFATAQVSLACLRTSRA